jgi:PEP-CTERM motif
MAVRMEKGWCLRSRREAVREIRRDEAVTTWLRSQKENHHDDYPLRELDLRGIRPMKTRIASLAILCLALASVPASAQVLYENGPVNGRNDAWALNHGYFVDDTFTLTGNSTVEGIDFYTWESPGDSLTSVDWSITFNPNSGTLYGSGTASGKNLTDSFISVNQYGYDIDKVTISGLNVPLATGRYWLNLLNANVPSGNFVYWDANDGVDCHSVGCPSLATANGNEGSIPSESFDVVGTSGGGTTPEPGSFLLLTSGVLGVAGVLRRKLL